MNGATATNFSLLRSLFDDRMNRLSRVSEAAGEQEAAETELVKTYLLEWGDHTLPETQVREGLTALFTTAPVDAVKFLRADFSSDDALMTVTGRYRGKRISAYIDFRDRRFLRLHSTNPSDLIDDLVRGWAARLPGLDHAWFDDSFLERCSKLGDFRGIGVEFSNEPLTAPSDEGANGEDRSESIRLRQSGRAQAMLELLQNSKTFSEQSSLAMVRVKYPRKSADKHVTAEIRYDGRITGRGNSFVRLAEVTDSIVDNYRKRVLDVERRYSMSARAVAGGYRLTGEPFKIALRPVVGDLAGFSERMFAAINPFRLAGVPRRVSEDHFIVHAIDLHTAQTLRFELRPHAIWVYLPKGTCGNSLLRFITNLQRHHSRLIKASDF